jgi:hypothetical protein
MTNRLAPDETVSLECTELLEDAGSAGPELDGEAVGRARSDAAQAEEQLAPQRGRTLDGGVTVHAGRVTVA